MKQVAYYSSYRDRRRCILVFVAGVAFLTSASLFGQGPSGAANRASDRARRNLGRRHGILSFTRATARQRATAEAKAQELQRKLREEWQRNNRTRMKEGKATRLSMRTVVDDLDKSMMYAVKVEPSSGAGDSVIAVNVVTGRVVSGTVVNTEIRVTPRTELSDKIREASQDPNVPGAAPAEFVNSNISLTAI